MDVLHLIILFAVMQVAIAFLTDGFGFTFDEGMWQYIGRNWFRHGLPPYSGGVDNKSPLIFAVFGISDKFFGVNYWFPRLLGIACQSVGLYFLYRIANHIAGKQAGLLALTLYGLSLLWRSTGSKYVAYTETYAVTCIIISFYLYLSAEKKSHFFLSGLIAGSGAEFRLSACFGILSLVVLLLRDNRRFFILFLAGIICSLLLFTGFLFLSGTAPKDFIYYAITDNFGAGSATDHPALWKLENFTDKFFYSELILFYPLILAYFFIKKKWDPLVWWLLCAFIGINVIGIYDRAHLKDMLPALSLMSAVSLNYVVETYKMPAKQVMMIVWISFFPKTIEPFVSLKKLFSHPSDQSGNYCHEPYPQPDIGDKRKFGLWIKKNTNDLQKVLIAGYGAEAQAYSERLSPSIYFNVTQTSKAKERFIYEVTQDKPAIVAVPLFAEYTRDVGADMRSFIHELVTENYNLDTCVYGYNIYRIKSMNK